MITAIELRKAEQEDLLGGSWYFFEKDDGMSEQRFGFTDALTGGRVECGSWLDDASITHGDGTPSACARLFFPGCSFANYGVDLMSKTYEILKDADKVDGISLLCCGKILAYEPDGQAVRSAFEDELMGCLHAAGVQRIVCACPNCVMAFRAMFKRDERMSNITIDVLPEVMASLGYKIDESVARGMVQGQLDDFPGFYEVDASAARPSEHNDEAAEAQPLFSIQDSCPDRKTKEFATGLRNLLPQGLAANIDCNDGETRCCGSLIRATGNIEAALQQSLDRGIEAVSLGAHAIITACFSCTFLLSVSQTSVPVFHYLELLFDERIAWEESLQHPKLRLLVHAPQPKPGQQSRPFGSLT